MGIWGYGSPLCVLVAGSTCSGRFRWYATWEGGFEDWYRLLTTEYLSRGLVTVQQSIPVYAPSRENDPGASRAAVMSAVDPWRAGQVWVLESERRKSMAFEKEWEAYRAQEAAKLRVVVEQARANWLGRRVWHQFMAEWVYGEVVDIGDEGQVLIDYAPNRWDTPWSRTSVHALGKDVILADE
jgi:hypothetical protein